MNTTLFMTLIGIQIALGLFDTLYHHELTERLAWRATQRRELKFHAVRNLIYAILFGALAVLQVSGIAAGVLLGLLIIEVIITLMDFVEEDRSRKLPATERVTHTLLALNYGGILLIVVPLLTGLALQDSSVSLVWYGWPSVMAMIASLGTLLFGLRDLGAVFRLPRLVPANPANLVHALGAPQTILVTGATGFIGQRLVEALVAAQHHVIVLTRTPEKALTLRAPFWLVTDLEQIPTNTHIDAVVNLAGEPISDGLWTDAKRARMINSRVEMTAGLLKLIARLEHRPDVLVNGSAIGWYGLWDDEMLMETSNGRDCFSRTLCMAWEAEAQKARALGVRVVLLRIGLVLGTEGGMLSRLLTPFEFGFGGPIGNGLHWMSWITRDDLVRLIGHAIATPELRGALNATAPNPVQNREFAKELGLALKRPSFVPLPAFPLRLLGGDFAKELLLGGQRVIPRKALVSGFVFQCPSLREALRSILDGQLPVNPAAGLGRDRPAQPPERVEAAE